jgi:hypothetical protein
VRERLLDRRIRVGQVRLGQLAEPCEVTGMGRTSAGFVVMGVILPYRGLSVVENGRRDRKPGQRVTGLRERVGA